MKLQGFVLAAFAAGGGGSTSVGALGIVPDHQGSCSRRVTLGWIAAGAVGGWTLPQGGETANAVADLPDSFDIDSYLRSGFVQNPMGVSGQAGECVNNITDNLLSTRMLNDC